MAHTVCNIKTGAVKGDWWGPSGLVWSGKHASLSQWVTLDHSGPVWSSPICVWAGLVWAGLGWAGIESLGWAGKADLPGRAAVWAVRLGRACRAVWAGLAGPGWAVRAGLAGPFGWAGPGWLGRLGSKKPGRIAPTGPGWAGLG